MTQTQRQVFNFIFNFQCAKFRERSVSYKGYERGKVMNSSESQGGIQPRKVWEPLVCAILALGLYMYNSASVTRLRAHQLAV